MIDSEDIRAAQDVTLPDNWSLLAACFSYANVVDDALVSSPDPTVQLVTPFVYVQVKPEQISPKTAHKPLADSTLRLLVSPVTGFRYSWLLRRL